MTPSGRRLVVVSDQKRKLSIAEIVGLSLVLVAVVGAANSGGTPVPLALLGFVVFGVGWMLRRN